MLQSEDNSRGAVARVADAGLEDILMVRGAAVCGWEGEGDGRGQPAGPTHTSMFPHFYCHV